MEIYIILAFFLFAFTVSIILPVMVEMIKEIKKVFKNR